MSVHDTAVKVHCNVSADHYSHQEWQDIEERCYPGRASQSGFLLSGDKLSTTLKDDANYLQEHGITCEQIADALETVWKKFLREEYLYVSSLSLHQRMDIDFKARKEHVVDGRYKVSQVVYMGAQTCPFQNKKLDEHYHGYEYGDRDVTVTDLKTGEQMIFNTLLIHMIRQHGFFESPRVSHRVSPEQVINMFEMQPEKKYSADEKSELYWRMSGCGGDVRDSTVKHLKRMCMTYIEEEGFYAFLVAGRNHDMHLDKTVSMVIPMGWMWGSDDPYANLDAANAILSETKKRYPMRSANEPTSIDQQMTISQNANHYVPKDACFDGWKVYHEGARYAQIRRIILDHKVVKSRDQEDREARGWILQARKMAEDAEAKKWDRIEEVIAEEEAVREQYARDGTLTDHGQILPPKNVQVVIISKKVNAMTEDTPFTIDGISGKVSFSYSQVQTFSASKYSYVPVEEDLL